MSISTNIISHVAVEFCSDEWLFDYLVLGLPCNGRTGWGSWSDPKHKGGQHHCNQKPVCLRTEQVCMRNIHLEVIFPSSLWSTYYLLSFAYKEKENSFNFGFWQNWQIWTPNWTAIITHMKYSLRPCSCCYVGRRNRNGDRDKALDVMEKVSENTEIKYKINQQAKCIIV